MIISVAVTEGRTVITVEGRVDTADVAILIGSVEGVLSRSGPVGLAGVELDLSTVTALSDTALAGIRRVYQVASCRRGMNVTTSSQRMRDLLALDSSDVREVLGAHFEAESGGWNRNVGDDVPGAAAGGGSAA